MIAYPAMLTALHIRDFAIIDAAALDFEGGLTVLTGETGAGKSILVDAVDLVLGGRGDAAVVRQGAQRAEVSAAFDLHDRPDAAAWLAGQALDADGECQLRRVVQADGRSRGFINGRPAPMQSLRELGALLVELHGQHEHQSLMHRDAQLKLLDGFAGNAAERGKVSGHWARSRELENMRDALPGGGDDEQNRLAYLQHLADELEEFAFSATEAGELETEQRRLAHAQHLITAAGAALEALDGDEAGAVCARLGRLQREMDELGDLDSRLGPVAELLSNALIQSQEAVTDLRHYLDNLELDPERLNAVEQRLGAAHELARKHKVSMEALPQTLRQLGEELDGLRNADARRAGLQRELDESRQAYAKAARALAKTRGRAAQALSRDVSALMETLSMRGGRFQVQVDTDPQRFSAHGTETVEFRVSTNPDQAPRPLRKVASGGELSRIALAIQVATVKLSGQRTLIFDEVDAGIGGAVAEIVGAKLRELGAAGQALCVTHLPQVAAQGHYHLQISKSVVDGATRTGVNALTSQDARTKEIARMLGGVRVTEKTRAHAKEMLGSVSAGP